MLGWLCKAMWKQMQRRRHIGAVLNVGEEQRFVNSLSSDEMEMTEIRLNP